MDEFGSATFSGIGPPTDTDTRLAEALRQMTSRFGRQPPAAVVLFSDGRARDMAGVLELARLYGNQHVPIHVFLAGDTTSGGDIALVSLVAPQQVRKYSTVDVQVFLRSFGYDGERVEVKILADGESGAPPLELASTPIALRSGVQSATLTYRTETRKRRTRVVVAPKDDELSTRNNELESDVGISRTKVRVLYIEGSSEPLRAVRRGDQTVQLGPHTALQEALVQDEDIECVPLVAHPNQRTLLRLSNDPAATARAFPSTKAELFAFDAVILSNIRREYFTDEQIEWLEQWVSSRGGGLCMVGGPGSYSAGDWQRSKVAGMLPVSFSGDQWLPGIEAHVVPPADAIAHPAWLLVSDRRQNELIVRAVPPIHGVHRGLEPKPLTSLLAASGDSTGDLPLMVAGTYGNGRTLALSVPTTAPWAANFMNNWGPGGNQYAAKFWRNLVYWVTENSSIGRRRLVATVDKQFYRPGETIALRSVTYNEAAQRTTSYRVWGMVEPLLLDMNDESLHSSLRWPSGLVRESGEDSQYVAWGEEFELAHNRDTGEYEVPLEIADRLRSGTDNQGLRIELTAYENAGASSSAGRGTQVDSTSIDVQILHDPFEHQNPFPNHDLLRRVASLSGGTVLSNPTELSTIIRDLPVEQASPMTRRVPIWSSWWIWGVLLALLTIEWIWRRTLGLA